MVTRKAPTRADRKRSSVLKLVSLGGAGEIGKNCAVAEYDDSVVVIDAGVMFPTEEMHGIDLVIPDFSYVIERSADLKGIVLSHGHEDHIGALPYLLRELDRPVPVYGSPLTLGLAQSKLSEHGVVPLAQMHPVAPREQFELGSFTAETFHVSHSVPDSRGVVLHTRLGAVIYTGDYKFDPNPVDGLYTDEERLAELGEEGTLVLLSDSTRVERPGYTPSESLVGATLDAIIAEAPGRVIVTTFASNVTRLAQVIAAADKHGRKVAIAGRSMENTLAVASELGFVYLAPETVQPLADVKSLPPEKVVLLTTGSQGEPTSVLSRIAAGDYQPIRIVEGDTVVIAATPVPGNEETVSTTIDNLFRRGARVIYGDLVETVHVSGHASAAELRKMIELVRPKFAVPIHGEYRHLVLYRDLAVATGIPPNHVVLTDNGDMLEFDAENVWPGPKVPAGSVLVDGLTVGNVSRVVLRDRQRLAAEGVVVAAITVDKRTGALIGGPDLMARGLPQLVEEDLMEQAKRMLERALKRTGRGEVEYGYLVHKIREVVGQFIRQRTGTQPMVLSVITEI